MNTRLVVMLGVAALGGPVAAQAAPITFDFTGNGWLYNYVGSGGTTSTPQSAASTGYVTLDVLSPGPTGPDGTSDANRASDPTGWVQSDFFIQWDGGSFAPGPVTGLRTVTNTTEVRNDYFALFYSYDSLYNGVQYTGHGEDGTTYLSYASLSRLSQDTSWLSDLTFDSSAGFATGTGAYNLLSFGDTSYALNTATNQNDYSGWYGSIALTSLTERPTNVPEPATLALLSLGLGGIGFVRRRRA